MLSTVVDLLFFPWIFAIGRVCFRVCDAFQPKTQNKPAKRPALDARLRTTSRRISASFNVRPQNREKRASSRVLLISSALTLATLPNRAEEWHYTKQSHTVRTQQDTDSIYVTNITAFGIRLSFLFPCTVDLQYNLQNL